MDIDRALARALDADDPGPAFAGRVVAAIRAEQAPAFAGEAASTTAGRPWAWRTLLPIAAAVALTLAGLQWRTAHVEDARARAAHAQLVQALRLTGETLSVVHRAIERSQE